MRVVVAAKAAPKGGKSSSLINYMAKSKLKPDKEKLNDEENERPLFSQKDEKIEFTCKAEAEAFLCQNVPNGEPPLSQLIISFDAEELAEISPETETQDEIIREIVGEALKGAAKDLENSLGEPIADFRWVAVIHRNTDHPHVHVAINRQLLTAHGKVITLKHLPRVWLPHRAEDDQELEAGSIARYLKDRLEMIKETNHQKTQENIPLPDPAQKVVQEEKQIPENTPLPNLSPKEEQEEELLPENKTFPNPAQIPAQKEERKEKTTLETVLPQTDLNVFQHEEVLPEPKMKLRIRQTAAGSEFYMEPEPQATQNNLPSKLLMEPNSHTSPLPKGRQNLSVKEYWELNTNDPWNEPVSQGKTESIHDQKKNQERTYLLRYLRALYKLDRESAQQYAQFLPKETLHALEERLARKVKSCGYQFALTLRQREESFHKEAFEFVPSGTSLSLVHLRDVEIEGRAAEGRPYEKLLHPTEWVAALAQDLGTKLFPYRPVLEKLEKIEQKGAAARQRFIEKTAVWIDRAFLNTEILNTTQARNRTSQHEDNNVQAKRTRPKGLPEVAKSVEKCEERVVKELLKRHLTGDELKDVKEFFVMLAKTEEKFGAAISDFKVRKEARSAMLLNLYVKEARLEERARRAERPNFYETVRLRSGSEVMVAKVMREGDAMFRRMVAAHLLKQQTYAQTRKEKLETVRHLLEDLWRLKTDTLLLHVRDLPEGEKKDLPPKAVSIAERALKEMSLPMAQAVPLAQRYYQSVANIKEYYLRQAQRYEQRAAAIHRKIDRMNTTVVNKERQPTPSRNQTGHPSTGTSTNQKPSVVKLRQTETKLVAEAEKFRQKAQALEARAASVAVSFELHRLRWKDELGHHVVQYEFQPVLVSNDLVNLKSAGKRKIVPTNTTPSRNLKAPTSTEKMVHSLAPKHQPHLQQGQRKQRVVEVVMTTSKNLFSGVTKLLGKGTVVQKESLHTNISTVLKGYENSLTEKLKAIDQLVRTATEHGFSPSLKLVDEKLKHNREILENLRPQIESAQTTLRHNHALKQYFPQQAALVYACLDRLNSGAGDYWNSRDLSLFANSQKRSVEQTVKDFSRENFHRR